MSSIKNKEKYMREKNTINLYPAMVNKNDGKYYGYIDDRGKFVLEAKFQQAYDFNEDNRAIVKIQDKFAVIDKEGIYICNPIFNSISNFKENRAIFTIDNKMGVISSKGEILVPQIYDFIGEYSEGKAVIGIDNKGSYLYGYININGELDIKEQYIQANDYVDGYALVKGVDNTYKLIDERGKIKSIFNYKYVSQYNNGLLVYEEEFDGPIGYINIDGQVQIKAKFKQALQFNDGIAVVSEESDFMGPYGAIDKTGKYIYEPIYSKILYLGEQRFALGMMLGKEKDIDRSIFAIADNKGNILSNFDYLQVGKYKENVGYASNETKTFFLNYDGTINNKLPMVEGSGDISIKANIIYANIDYEPFYLGVRGKSIYTPNKDIVLNNQYSVFREKYKPNINYLIYNPKILGISEKTIENNVNLKLKELSSFRPYNSEKNEELIITKNDVLDYNYYGDFEIIYFKENILVLELTGYYYPLGAAHGMPYKKTPTINLTTGHFYVINDLFLKGALWEEELNTMINYMIKNDPKYSYIFPDSFKGISKEQSFYIDKDNLYIYFNPYEIGPYAAGFITFKIPFWKIAALLNKDELVYKSIGRFKR